MAWARPWFWGVRETCVSEPEGRSSLSVGFEWASRISTVGLEFALPPLLGAYLDSKAHTSPLLTLIGVILGFAVGMFHILRIGRGQPGQGGDGPKRKM